MAVPEIRVDLIPRRLRRGERDTFRLSLAIPEGYHIQAHEPSEELMIPTKISLMKVEGISIGEPIYPEPKLLPVAWSEVKLLTYEGRIDIAVTVEVAGDAKPGPCKVEGKLSYQGCTASACFPPREQQFTLALEIV